MTVNADRHDAVERMLRLRESLDYYAGVTEAEPGWMAIVALIGAVVVVGCVLAARSGQMRGRRTAAAGMEERSRSQMLPLHRPEYSKPHQAVENGIGAHDVTDPMFMGQVTGDGSIGWGGSK